MLTCQEELTHMDVEGKKNKKNRTLIQRKESKCRIFLFIHELLSKPEENEDKTKAVTLF